MRFRSLSVLISSSTSRPSFFGRLRSSRMMSGRGTSLNFPWRRRKSIASTPSFTVWRLEYTLPSFSASRVRRTSPGLSSTSRISIGPFLSTIGGSPLFRQREVECRALIRIRRAARADPDASAVALHHLLADRQPDAGARVLALVVQALEHHEDALVVLRLDADAVVLHFKGPFLGAFDDAHMDPGHGIRAELERVADQVLEELRELPLVGLQRRHRVVSDRGARFLDRGAQVEQRPAQRRFARHRPELLALGADARVGEQVLDQLLHARGAVDDVGHELARVALEAALVAPAEELRIARHHAQRLLQVVRGDVGELLQLRVASFQLFVRGAQRRLGVALRGDVVEDRDFVERLARRVALDRHGEFHPHDGTVLPQIALLDAHRVDLARVEPRALRVDDVEVVGMRDLPADEPEQLVLRIAEDLAQPSVDADEAPVEADVRHARGGELERAPVALLALLELRLGLALRGDVGDRRDQAVEGVGVLEPAQERGIHRQPLHRLARSLDADADCGPGFAGAHGDPRRAVVGADRLAVLVDAGQERREARSSDDPGERQAEDALLAFAQRGLGAGARGDVENGADQAARDRRLVVDRVAIAAVGSDDRRVVALAVLAFPELALARRVQVRDLGVLRIELAQRLADEARALHAEERLPGAVHAEVAAAAVLDEHRHRQA